MKRLEAVELSKSFSRTVDKIEDKKKRKKKKKHSKINEVFYAVDHVSFSVEEGEILGILGPNGAGKTTLLRMIGGIMETESGSVHICGKLLGEDNHLIKKKIAYISNNTKLYGRFTARELFLSFGKLYDLTNEEINTKIEELNKQLNLEEFLDNRIETLSTGQMQRINIARCLIHSPELYILDEPTLGLDIISSKDIIAFMKSEKERGKSVVYSTHYMEEAEYLCDRVIIIHKGSILAEGKVNELKETHGVNSIRDLFFKLADVKEEDNEN